MVAGDGGFGYLERVVGHTTEGGAIHFQFVGASGQPFAQKDESCHRFGFVWRIMFSKRAESNGNVLPEYAEDAVVAFTPHSGLFLN